MNASVPGRGGGPSGLSGLGLALQPQSLIGRVFLLYSLTLLLLAGGGLAWWTGHSRALSIASAQDTARTLTSLLGPSVTDAALVGDHQRIERNLRHAARDADIQELSFSDRQGARISATHPGMPPAPAPAWWVASLAKELPDLQLEIGVGGSAQGTLRLRIAVERIAHDLWSQALKGLAATLAAWLCGLALVWRPLHHWLGNLDRIRSFAEGIQAGPAAPQLLRSEDAPLEFRKTFELLNLAASSLGQERAQAAVTLAAIADGVAATDAEGRVLLANPALASMLECDAEDLHGQDLERWLPGLGEAGVHGALRVRRRLESGAERVLELNRSPIGPADGAATGWVVACRDVSQQQQLEDLLVGEFQVRSLAVSSIRRLLREFAAEHAVDLSFDNDDAEDIAALLQLVSTLMERLRSHSAQLDAIFALSPDGFVSFDASHTVRYASPAFARLTGLPEQGTLGLQAPALLAALQSRAVAAAPLNLALLQQGRQRIELLRPARRVLELAVYAGDQEPATRVLHVNDVTSQVELDQMKSEFLATAAHELRTPITSVYGFTELLMSRRLPPQRQQSLLERIYRQSGAMMNILNELLDLSRIEARRGKDFHIQNLALAELLAEAAQDFQPPDGRDGPQLQMADAAAAAARIDGDRRKLLQVLRNLLSNAYKFSPAGGEVRVALRVQPDQQVCLEVVDCGIGMSEEELSHVTERFYRADKSGNTLGTGLGMSIVKEIVVLHGGRLLLRSRPGQGTVVQVLLPLAALAPSAGEAAPAAALPA